MLLFFEQAQELSYLYGADDLWKNGQVDDEKVKKEFEQKFKDYYMFREIGQETVSRFKHELKSFLIYKIQGSKAYLNHIANYGSKENLINLWKLFYQELNNQRIIYLDLWYNKQNKKAENMYNIEQFQPLNMYNFCYEKL